MQRDVKDGNRIGFQGVYPSVMAPTAWSRSLILMTEEARILMERRRHTYRRMHVIAHHGRRSLLAGGAALILLALLLAGCGASTTRASAGVGASASATAAARATSTATRRPGPSGGLSARPCPGPFGSAPSAGNGVVVLTPSSPALTAHAQIGQTVEVQLPASVHWRYDATASAPNGLALIQPAGMEDGQLDLCIWSFQAQSTGTATLTFTGTMLCDPVLACSNNVQTLAFTVKIG